MIIKGLFEIDKGLQKGQNEGKNVRKSGRKKNFYLGDFGVKKWEKVGQLRKQDRPKKIGKRLRRNTACQPRSIAGRAELARYTLARV